MRFQRLDIPAFGPFTNLELSFPSADHDLHVIYGANEAGKSSLLRAIRDLLFGIRGQSSDNFLHDYKKLRLVGEIVNRAGTQLTFQRRKGNQRTLLDREGEALSDEALLPFLGGVDQGYFSAMFGLGNKELEEGAEQLLRGEGEIGDALFSASLGGTPVQQVLDSLVEESERLFKGRAKTNVSIRPAVKRYKELLKQSRDAMVNPETWSKLETGLGEQQEHQNRLTKELRALDEQIGWLARCEDALPSVGLLKEQLALLQSLPKLPDLASDFVERAQVARQAVSECSGRVEALKKQLEQMTLEETECVPSSAFIAESEALDLLHQALGAYRERKETLKNLRSRLAGLEPSLRQGMQSLGVEGEFESLRDLRLSSAVRLSCEAAAGDFSQALHHREESVGKSRELEQAIQAAETDLEALPETDLTPLRDALAVAAEATDADKTLGNSETEIENLTRSVTMAHALVLGAPDNRDAAAALAVPAKTTIKKFRDRFERGKRSITDEESKILEAGERIKTIQAELARLDRLGQLPSEEALVEARRHRDHGWDLVLAEWKGDGAKETLDPGTPLEEAFPKTVKKADDIADRLRHQAEAVAQAEEKRAQMKTSENVISERQKELEVKRQDLEACQTEWENEWDASGIRPQSPEEMDEWRDSWIDFRDALDRLREVETSIKAKKDKVLRAKETLATVLGDSSEKVFSVLFEAAKRSVQQGEEQSGRRSLIVQQLQERRKQLENSDYKNIGISETLKTSKAAWVAQCELVGLSPDTAPEAGLQLLQERAELVAKFDLWLEQSEEAQSLETISRDFEKSVQLKADQLNTGGETSEAQESRLWEGLTRARSEQAKHEQVIDRIKKAKNELETVSQAETRAKQSLDELMQLAKLESVEALEPLLVNLERRDVIRGRIDDFRQTLSGIARGQSVDEFVERVSAENAEELSMRKAELETVRAEKAENLEAIRARLGELKSEMQDMEKAGDAAADYRQQAESLAAALKQDASRYVRLRLAVNSLRTQIERFREENQGPLLERSGQLFKEITRNAFESLGADFNEQDVPVMVGLRSDGTKVSVDGMSDGSRDQLYLALRLAALDHYLQDHEPMPLILDDLLITFDDGRARAILPQLASLAKKTQVFLFTHHDHLVQLCRQTLGPDQFKLHQLSETAKIEER